MTRGERVRMARKTLGLTLEKFGAKIGLKKSSLSQVETGVNDLTESNIKAICREFNIDEKWLRDGVGSMFIESETFSLDEFAAQHNATDLEKEIIIEISGICIVGGLAGMLIGNVITKTVDFGLPVQVSIKMLVSIILALFSLILFLSSLLIVKIRNNTIYSLLVQTEK